eukprot:g83100.t1
MVCYRQGGTDHREWVGKQLDISVRMHSQLAFKTKLATATQKVCEILHDEKHPRAAADVHHVYSDKFSLANQVTQTAIAAHLKALRALGFTNKTLLKAQAWSKGSNVTLRFEQDEKCTFIEKKETWEDADTEHVRTVAGAFNFTVQDKVRHKIKKWYWTFEEHYKVVVFPGSLSSQAITIRESNATTVLVTGSESPPHKELSIKPRVDVSLGWLLSHLGTDLVPSFEIDRMSKHCCTPRRNQEVEACLTFFSNLAQWTNSVMSALNGMFAVKSDHALDLSTLRTAEAFVPIVAVLKDYPEDEAAQSVPRIEAAQADDEGLLEVKREAKQEQSTLLTAKELNKLLEQQAAEFDEQIASFAKVYPEEKDLIRQQDAALFFACNHMNALSTALQQTLDHVEEMLRSQLIAAVGKELTPSDFDQYMNFHFRKILKAAYLPAPFCYAVRRPDHYPEGTLTIEAQVHGMDVPQPIITQASQNPRFKEQPMKFKLNAATEVTFAGPQYLHGWLTYQYAGAGSHSYQISCRARQYSCFIVMIGTLNSATDFAPSHAMIVQNKDEFIIPLLLEHLPTAKEFKDAIASLSPEQQRFCQAVRSMQLESTLFGLCVIQIKPQLEKLLHLDNTSLTKERRLTHELLKLFIKYQISSDLVKFDGEAKSDSATKVEQVRKQVSSLLKEIKEETEAELADKRKEVQYQHAHDIALHDLDMAVRELQPAYSMKKKSKMRRSEARPVATALAMSSAPMPPVYSAPPPRSVQPTSAPPPKPSPQPAQPAQPTPPERKKTPSVEGPSGGEEGSVAVDYTSLPAALDAQFLSLDQDNALRAGILKVGDSWTKKSTKSVLAKQETTQLQGDNLKDEKNAAFDLLDALSRSGELEISESEMHIILPVTHCFYSTLIDTVVQKNVNPVEKVERTSLILGSMIQRQPVDSLLQSSQEARLRLSSPMLFKAEQIRGSEGEDD